jgi:hypothetical protein
MLAWRQAYKAVEHIVYLFAEEGLEEGHTPSEILLRTHAADGTNTLYPFRSEQGRALLLRAANSSFSWRVDAVHMDGSVAEGPRWNFATP